MNTAHTSTGTYAHMHSPLAGLHKIALQTKAVFEKCACSLAQYIVFAT